MTSRILGQFFIRKIINYLIMLPSFLKVINVRANGLPAFGGDSATTSSSSVARLSRSPGSWCPPSGGHITPPFESHREQSSLLALSPTYTETKTPTIKGRCFVSDGGANGTRTHDLAATERCDNHFTIAPINILLLYSILSL